VKQRNPDGNGKKERERERERVRERERKGERDSKAWTRVVKGNAKSSR
jgi:hypothetical protein